MFERIVSIALTSLLCLFTFPSYSQVNTDSLLSLYENQPDDTSKVRTISALVDAYLYSEPQKAKIYIDEGMQLSHKLDYPLGLAAFHNQMAAWFYGEHDSSTYYYEKGLEYADKAGDLSQKAKMYYGLAIIAFDQGKLDEADSMVNEVIELDELKKDTLGLGIDYTFRSGVHMNKGNYNIALKHILKSLEYIRKAGDATREADALNRLASIEYYLKHFESAIQNNEKAVEIYRRLNDISYESQALNDIGNCYSQLKNYEKAEEYYKLSLEKARQVNLMSIEMSVLSNLGKVAIDKGVPEKGLIYFFEAMALDTKNQLKRKKAVTQFMMARAYNELKQPHKAIPLLNESIAYSSKANSQSTLKTALAYRSKSYELMGNYQQALEDFQRYEVINDSLTGVEKSKQIEELRIIHDTEQKEAALALQQAEIANLNLEVRESNLRKALYAIGMISFIIISALLYVGFKQKIKRDRIEREKQEALYEQEIAFKQKELASQTLHLVHKNTFHQELTEILQGIRKSPETFQTEFRRIMSLMKIEDNADKDWEVFKSYFADVHDNFDHKLRAVTPDLSETELRLASLLKMNLTTKEIAAIMKVQPNSVLKSKYRLKKKLKLEKEEDLVGYLVGV